MLFLHINYPFMLMPTTRLALWGTCDDVTKCVGISAGAVGDSKAPLQDVARFHGFVKKLITRQQEGHATGRQCSPAITNFNRVTTAALTLIFMAFFSPESQNKILTSTALGNSVAGKTWQVNWRLWCQGSHTDFERRFGRSHFFFVSIAQHRKTFLLLDAQLYSINGRIKIIVNMKNNKKNKNTYFFNERILLHSSRLGQK